MENYLVSLPIVKISPEVELPCDVYLFVSGHFVKYKLKGDSISADKYNQFILKKITHLFTTQEELTVFVEWADNRTAKETEELVEAVGEKNKDLVDARQEAIGLLQEMFFQEDVTEESVDQLMANTRKIINKVMSDDTAKNALTRMISYSQALADHSMNVAFLSVYLAQHLGYNHQIILENIYLGGLMHDFGKTRIDPNILEGGDEKKYIKAMRAHPELGKTFLMAKTSLPEEVLHIVAQHHERNDGKGYPKGMRGGRMYDLSKIVAIANYYVDEFSARDEIEPKDRHVEVVKLIESDEGKRFDPKKAASSVKALRLLTF